MRQDMPRGTLRVLIGFGAVLISWVLFHQLYWKKIQEERLVESFDFQTTELEQKCFHGAAVSSSPIPNVVHFIWGLKDPAVSGTSDPDISFIHYLAVRSALISLHPDTIKIHYVSVNKSSTWLKKLTPHVTFTQHDLAAELGHTATSTMQPAHLADMLRLAILHREGGIYMDLDVFALRPLDALRSASAGVVLGSEGGDRHGLCNAVVLARAGAGFLARWSASYVTFDPREWNFHSVILPLRLARTYPDEVCTLAPTVFFWPTWTRQHVRFMHEVLAPAEAREVQAQLERNGGALYVDQLVYHAWSQVAWKKYLRDLTPGEVRARDTRFNLMVRRFLDDGDG